MLLFNFEGDLNFNTNIFSGRRLKHFSNQITLQKNILSISFFIFFYYIDLVQNYHSDMLKFLSLEVSDARNSILYLRPKYP